MDGWMDGWMGWMVMEVTVVLSHYITQHITHSLTVLGSIEDQIRKEDAIELTGLLRMMMNGVYTAG